MVFQAIKHNSQGFIYLSFDVRVDESFDAEDVIVLDFRPDFATGPAHNVNERRIDIFPVFAGTGGGNHPVGGSCVGVTGSAQPDDNLPVPMGFPPSTNFHTRTNRCPQNVEYRKWNMGTSQWDSMPAISNAEIRVRSWDLGMTNKNWSVEIKLPTQRTGPDGGGVDWIDFANNFAFYYDVIRVCDSGICSNTSGGGGSGNPSQGFYTVQYTWPRADYSVNPPTRVIQDPAMGPSIDLATFEIPPSWLGEAIMGPGGSCQGVRFQNGSQGIGIKTAPSPAPLITTINGALGATNVFTARVVNDGAGPAPGVKARFRIANWGVIGDADAPWDDVPAKPPSSGNTNPVGGMTGITIPTGATPTDLSMSWTIDSGDRDQFKVNGGTRDPHQCVYVTLSSTQDVDFADSSVHNNFEFVGLSSFDDEAEINGKGFVPPESGTIQDFLLRTYSIPTYSLRAGDDGGPGTVPNRPKRQSDQIRPTPENISALEQTIYARQSAESKLITTWLWGMVGYRRGSGTLTIGTKKFRVYQPVGSFGYGAEHGGPIKELKASVAGTGLKPITGDGYQLPVPDGGVVRLKVRLEAVEPGGGGGGTNGKFAVFFHGGVNFPHGNFGNIFDPGFSFNGGLEYAATNYFSLEGIFGYHRFRGRTFGSVSVADLNVFQFSGNGKFYLVPPGSVRPWVNFGIGAYKFESGPTRFGGNVGAGLQFKLTPKFALEGAYNLHAVTSSFGSDAKFSTLQGGVRFWF